MIDWEERVDRGFELMQSERSGWLVGIDVDALNVFDPDWCVLGQTFGYYTNGLDTLDLGMVGAVNNGFLITAWEAHELAEEFRAKHDAEPDPVEDIYGPLTEAWKRKIRAARGEG